MADFKFTIDQYQYKYQDLDLLASIVKLLDSHSIPNVVAGSYPLRAYGHNYNSTSFSLVINNKNIDKAYDVLLAAGFPPCTRGNSCCYVYPRTYPTPYAHFYICQKAENPDHWFPLKIFIKSHLLWAMPDIPLGAPAPGDPDYMLITDDRLPETHPRLRTGRVASTHYPIKIPTPARYAEALVLLTLRDAKPGREMPARRWRNFILEMTYTDVLKLEDLTDPRIRRYYELSRDEKVTVRDLVLYEDQLKVEMRETKEIPHPTFRRLTRGRNQGIK